MPKYMITASYSAEGAKGLVKEGGSARRAMVQKLVEGMGGRVTVRNADDEEESGLIVSLALPLAA